MPRECAAPSASYTIERRVADAGCDQVFVRYQRHRSERTGSGRVATLARRREHALDRSTVAGCCRCSPGRSALASARRRALPLRGPALAVAQRSRARPVPNRPRPLVASAHRCAFSVHSTSDRPCPPRTPRGIPANTPPPTPASSKIGALQLLHERETKSNAACDAADSINVCSSLSPARARRRARSVRLESRRQHSHESIWSHDAFRQHPAPRVFAGAARFGIAGAQLGVAEAHDRAVQRHVHVVI